MHGREEDAELQDRAPRWKVPNPKTSICSFYHRVRGESTARANGAIGVENRSAANKRLYEVLSGRTLASTQRSNSRGKPGGARANILDVATQLFGASGYAGTTMRDIADAVGILPGSLYAHIEGKEQVLFEIVNEGIDTFLGAADPATDEECAADIRMRLAINGHLRVVADSPQRSRVVFHQWRYLSEPNLGRIVEKRRRYEQIFTEIMQSGVKSGAFNAKLDTHIAVLTVLGALNWTAEWFSPGRPSEANATADRLADTLLQGIVSRSS
jgi:AcrR family transcriptional regulator